MTAGPLAGHVIGVLLARYLVKGKVAGATTLEAGAAETEVFHEEWPILFRCASRCDHRPEAARSHLVHAVCLMWRPPLWRPCVLETPNDHLARGVCCHCCLAQSTHIRA